MASDKLSVEIYRWSGRVASAADAVARGYAKSLAIVKSLPSSPRLRQAKEALRRERTTDGADKTHKEPNEVGLTDTASRRYGLRDER